MNIRLASEKDYDAVLSLMGQLNPEDPVIHEPLGRELFSRILHTDGLYIYVAEIEGIAVATCYLNVMPNLTRGGQSYALIENVVTDHGYRRAGIGASLLDEVVSRAFELDCYKVMLLSGRDSNVHTFYESCGFSKNSKTAFIRRSTSE